MNNFSDKNNKKEMGSCFEHGISKDHILFEQDNVYKIEKESNHERIICEIKWFNNEKGYGFAGSSKINRDIFIHISKIHDANVEMQVIPGDIIDCDVVMDAHMQKPIVSKIYQLTRNQINMNNLIKIKAIVKWFNYSSDCGFVNNGHYDIFVSGILLRKMNIPKEIFYEGVEVECHFTEMDGKKIAHNIRVLSQCQEDEKLYA
ncbi:hypothetical protein FZC35_01845 [Candidatus Cytomitobacter indipagum]|uniref:CSD domain-containing protein n=1 Tax=Candidatus Cytomitobacter indipagum TaxID=2601575 RepID=A0A5C0UEI6_9PROT|nr:cold shock domain-containing protein [Candidatus Cytomitobacter indipagum]QEK38110.1 hypothetical protein FZC35_01845 [Candidatus Cytomitobacter indipagum]